MNEWLVEGESLERAVTAPRAGGYACPAVSRSPQDSARDRPVVRFVARDRVDAT